MNARNFLSLRFLLVLVIISVFNNRAFANSYDRCNGILAKGLYDKFESDYSSEDLASFKKWLCSTDEGKHKSKSSFELNIPIEGIPFGLNLDDSELSDWKRSNCSNNEKNYHGTKSSHLLIQRVNKHIVDAWKECVLNDSDSKGLVCMGRETEEGLVMTVELRYGMKSLNKIDISYSNLRPVGNTIGSFDRLGGGGHKIIQFDILQRDHESRFVFNGEGKNVYLGCEYIIPIKKDEEADQCENIRMAAFHLNIISKQQLERYRVYNLVPLVKGGRVIGEALCE